MMATPRSANNLLAAALPGSRLYASNAALPPAAVVAGPGLHICRGHRSGSKCRDEV